MKCRIIFLFILSFNILGAQDIYQHTSKSSIYEFLDEVATQQLIEINSGIKPYSRVFIADKLSELDGKREELNPRQEKELDFFLKDYNKELKREEFNKIYNSSKFFSKQTLFSKSENKRLDALFYSDDKFQVTVNPVIGIDYNLTDNAFRRWYGGEVNAYLGKGFAAYFSFRDVSENKLITSPLFLDQLPAGVNRPNNQKNSTEYSEVRGGLTYSWKWGSVGLLQDQFEWGNNANGGIIFSGRNPAIPHLKLQIKPNKWFEFNYIHAQLSSEVIDSVRTYGLSTGVDRIIYQQKYMAANMFTLKPVKNLNVSFGNSVVYSDVPLNLGYVIPFFFYRSVDHVLSGQDNKAGQNGQLFLDISSRNIPYVHLYGSLFIDEIRFSTVFDEATQRNQLSFKFGLQSQNIANTNLSVVTEYTRSNPYSYRHFIPSSTFASSQYNLGHYLGGNSQEIYLGLEYKPLARLKVKFYYSNARKGETNPFGPGGSGGIQGTQFLTTTEFERTEIGLEFSYEIIHDVTVSGNFVSSDVEDDLGIYTPTFLQGKNTLGILKLNWAF